MHSMHPFAPGAQICFICFWVSNQFFEIPIPRLIMHVLSIQSHVVHGYVGNKAATFPLQLLGFEVDPLNAVQFSNHTGYPKFTGERLEGPQIEKLLEGLELNGMLEHYSHLLTGYLGRASTLHAVAGLVAKLRQLNPQVIFVLDPVMGDEGSLYVPPELVPIYRDVLCPLADVVTPNAFEAEQLTGIPINSTQNARLALSNIHNLGVPTVIITSAELADTQQDSESRTLHLLASRRLPKSGRLYQFTVEFPKLDVSFTGTGDMFSALLLANIHLGEKEARKVEEALILNDEQEDTIAGVALRTACERAVASMQGVLADTLARYKKRTKSWKNDCGRKGSPEMMRSKELTVVQSRERIERPEVVYQAKDLHE
ncbi:pyridoxal kinase [Zopfochytrium polystomum]|nr:pyridoxal kinase [Zopfochytrium polystomum]